MPGEPSMDLQEIGKPVKDAFEQFALDTGQMREWITMNWYFIRDGGGVMVPL